MNRKMVSVDFIRQKINKQYISMVIFYIGMALLLFMGLFALKFYNYLLFHCIAETINYTASFIIFIVVLSVWKDLKNNNFLSFLGISLFFVGIIDLLHMLAYQGMSVFVGYDSDLPVKLWVLARYIQTFSLFIGIGLISSKKQIYKACLISVQAMITILGLASIFVWRIFPACYSYSTGLTRFKTVSEYIICIFLLTIAISVWRKRAFFNKDIFRLIIISFVFQIAAELEFSVYFDVYGFTNFLGHYFIMISTIIFCRAILVTAISSPGNVLYKALKKSERQLQEAQRIGNMGNWELGLVNSEFTCSNQTASILEIDSKDLANSYKTFLNVIHPLDRERREKALSTAISSREKYNSIHRLLLPKDKIKYIQEQGEVTCDANGIPMKVNCIIKDISEQKKYEEEILRLNSDLENRVLERTIQLDKINREMAVTNIMLEKEIIERKKVEEKIKKLNDELENKVRERTAQLNTINAVLEDEVAEHRITEQNLKESEEKYRMIFNNAGDAIIVHDFELKILTANLIACQRYGYTTDEIMHISFGMLCPSTKYNQMEYMADQINKFGYALFETVHQHKDGLIIPTDVNSRRIMWNGNPAIISVCRDITERKHMELKLEFLSYRDQLTGIYNRRFFEEELSRLDNESNLPLSVIVADINGLKLINDSFGHAVGDELIKKGADVILKGCRAGDVIARLGGDEFVVLMTQTDVRETERIVRHIRALALKERVGSVGVSISFGYETKKNADEKIQDILKKAEDHMYRNKLFESPSTRGKTINVIINTLHEKNKREEQHSHRVSELCKCMGMAIGLREEEIEELRTVGLLHDIGKIAIEENILNKPGTLSEDEWEQVKCHPEIGYRILSAVNDMSEMAEYVLAHHERWDGKGYPKGLKGKEIPLQSRIISIIDTYDAMTSTRSYRAAVSEENALAELKKNAGSQFDPELVEIFIESLKRH